MKKLYILSLVFILLFGVADGRTVIIKNDGYKFSPNNISLALGDTIIFSLYFVHNVVEVSKTTYDKNDTVSNGGFKLPFSGGELVVNKLGTFYYVCVPHAHMGMKGVIEVVESLPTAIGANKLLTNTTEDLILYPNPTSSYVNLELNLKNASRASITISNLSGQEVKLYNNLLFHAGLNNYKIEYNGTLKKGNYFVVVNLPEGSYRKLLLVQ